MNTKKDKPKKGKAAPLGQQELCGEIGAFNFAQEIAAEASERLRPIFENYIGKPIAKQEGSLLKRVTDNPTLQEELAYLRSRSNSTAQYGNGRVQFILLNCEYGYLQCEVSVYVTGLYVGDIAHYNRCGFNVATVNQPGRFDYDIGKADNAIIELCEPFQPCKRITLDDVLSEARKIESLKKKLSATSKLVYLFSERTIARALD